MPSAGFIGVGTQLRRNKKSGVAIKAVVAPATSPLVVGQALQDTVNWSTFINPTNYATNLPGESIDTVTVNYIGSTPDAITAFADGNTNHFSITVTDTIGSSATFTTTSRTVLYAPAVNTIAPVLSGSLGLGDTVTISDGTWTGDVGGSYVYSILVNGIEVSTSNSYTIQAGDSAGTITGTVSYVNSGGTGEVAASNTLTVETFAAPSVLAASTITGTPTTGTSVIGVPATFTGNPTPSEPIDALQAVTPGRRHRGTASTK